MLAVHGKSFCSSAHDAFQLIFSNGMRALVLECLSAFLLFLSKLAVTFISGLIAFLIITNQIEFVHLGDFDDLNYYWGPLGVKCFYSIYIDFNLIPLFISIISIHNRSISFSAIYWLPHFLMFMMLQLILYFCHIVSIHCEVEFILLIYLICLISLSLCK